MTQTPPATDGVVLEPSEFYYLLRTYHAAGVIGLDEEGLFPPPGPAADALLDEGFAKLQLHGWLKPADGPGRFDLHPEVALLAAVVADAQYVVVSARNLSEAERAMANHYLGEDLIVELTVTPSRHIRLVFVLDRTTMLQRVENVLAPTFQTPPPARYSLPEPEFEAIQRLARAGQTPAAVERLVAAGVSAQHAQSLAQALQSIVGDGIVVVVRAGAGEILGGRKAAVHNGAAGAWLARRETSTTIALTIETVHAGTVSGVVESCLKSLSVLLAPVA